MSDSSNMQSLLEQKKARLEALKRRKKEALAASQQSTAAAADPAPAPTPDKAPASFEDVVSNVDALVKEAPKDEPAGGSGGGARAPGDLSRLSSTAVLNVVDIAPRVNEVYSKETQTVDADGLDDSSMMLNESMASSIGGGASELAMRRAATRELTPQQKTEIVTSDTFQHSFADITGVMFKELGMAPVAAGELEMTRQREVEARDDFKQFFARASLTVERALGNHFDPTIDYSVADDEGAAGRTRELIQLEHKYFDDKLCRNRVVTDVKWSPHHMELYAAAYSAKKDSYSQDPDGLVLVWSTNMQARPEYHFTCQSAVMCVLFNEFSPSFLIAGTYSGQIVMWDTRAKSTPVQRTPLSANGHTHPVYSMQVVGTQHAHNLVSVSTDGRVCVWSMDKLVQPQEVLSLKIGGKKDVAATCLGFPNDEVNNFFVGSEEGAVYQCFRHGTKPGANERQEGHAGPITALECHPAGGPVDFSHLMLTSGTDWSCRLWSTRGAKAAATPLATFEQARDYVYSISWAPSHPAVFACVDGVGFLDVWDINRDPEVPLERIKVTEHALNKVAWSRDGRRVSVGDSTGAVHVYAVASEVSAPKADDWAVLELRISQMQAAVDDEHAPMK